MRRELQGLKDLLPSKAEDSGKFKSVSIDERSYDTFDDASLLVTPRENSSSPDCEFDLSSINCLEVDEKAREKAAAFVAPDLERIRSKVNAHTTKEAQDTRALLVEEGHNTRAELALVKQEVVNLRSTNKELLTSVQKLLRNRSTQREGIRSTRLFDGDDEAGAPEPPKPKRRRMGGKSREDRIAARNEDAMRAHYQRANARKRAAAQFRGVVCCRLL